MSQHVCEYARVFSTQRPQIVHLDKRIVVVGFFAKLKEVGISVGKLVLQLLRQSSPVNYR